MLVYSNLLNVSIILLCLNIITIYIRSQQQIRYSKNLNHFIPKSKMRAEKFRQSQKKGGISTTEYSKLRFGFLSQIQAEQAANLYTQSFLDSNTLWKSLGANYNQVFSVNKARIVACSKGGFSFILTDPRISKILAVALSLDVLDYLDFKPIPNNSQCLQVLGKYATKLQKETFQSLRQNIKRGDVIYNYGAAVTTEFMNGGISRKFWAMAFTYVKIAGFKFVYFRATNRASTHLLLGFGAQVINVVHITEPGVENEFMELVKLNLNKLSYDTLTKYYEDIDPTVQDDSDF